MSPTTSSSSNASLAVTGFGMTDEERRIMYQTPLLISAGKKRKLKHDLVTVGCALDDLINAPTRGIQCRRRVSVLYYNNDKNGMRSSLHLRLWALITAL